jgi:hypothetical protein
MDKSASLTPQTANLLPVTKAGRPDRRYHGVFTDETGREWYRLGDAAVFFRTTKQVVSDCLHGRLPSWRGHSFRYVVPLKARLPLPDGEATLVAVVAEACARSLTLKDVCRLVRSNAHVRQALALAAVELA